MEKWADFLISAVRYNAQKTHIDKVRSHKDEGDNVGTGEETTREDIVRKIKEGKTFVTIYKSNDKWKKGEDVRIVDIDGQEYIRTDRNRTKKDNLGELPEF